MEAPDHPDCSGPGHTCLGEIDLGDGPAPAGDFSLFAEAFEGGFVFSDRRPPQNDEDLPEGRPV